MRVALTWVVVARAQRDPGGPAEGRKARVRGAVVECLRVTHACAVLTGSARARHSSLPVGGTADLRAATRWRDLGAEAL